MDPRERMMWLVLILVDEFRAKQTDVARVFQVSPATISLWLKEMRLRQRIQTLERELGELRLIARGYVDAGQIGVARSYEIPQLR